MKTISVPPMVPVNKIGKAVNLQKSVTEKTEEEARELFRKACDHLLNPELWHTLSGETTAHFKVIPRHENDTRNIQVNDYFQIDIPGPGTSAGDGYDWVKVSDIQQNPDLYADESFGMTVRAWHNPRKPELGTAHFFQETATSTFIISRSGKTVYASYYGRNEKPNENKTNLFDKVRNVLVGLGAMAGLSEVQWSALLEGLLNKKEAVHQHS
jgi:hypothetical protein